MNPARTTASRLAHSPVVLVGAVFLFSWPVATLQAEPGLDPSWHAGLAMAAREGVRFGGDIVFTYGPLGFLRFPALYYGSTSALAFLYVALLHLVLCASLFVVLRRPLSGPLAALFATAGAIITPEPAIVITAIWAVEMLRPDGHPSTGRIFPPAAGALAGLELLVKLNVGVTVLAIAVIAIAVECPRRPRAPAEFLVALTGALGGLWLVSGQSLADIGPFVRGAFELTAGYSGGMGFEEAGARWHYVGALVLVAGVGVAAWQATAGADAVRRAGALAILAVTAFLAFKEGFVRHDVGHGVGFFRTMGGVAFAYVPARLPMRWVVAAGAGLLAAVALTQAYTRGPGRLAELFTRPSTALSQAFTLVHPDRRAETVERNRSRVRKEWKVEPRLLALVRGHTVNVDPWELDVVWAYRLRWRPAPTLQSYSAYTPWLDHRSADVLASDDAPERILRHRDAIDGRAQQFDPPAGVVAMLCRYREVGSGGRWQVLARGPDRCGRRRPLATVVAPPGRAVAVPDPGPGRAVVVEIEGVEPQGLERVRALLHRPAERRVRLDGGRDFRLVPATAGDGLLVRVPRAADWSPPLAADPRARSITVVSGAGGLAASDEITYRFHALPIRP